HTHTLRCTDRTELVFTHGFADIDELAAMLRKKTAEHILPRARETLREGRAIAFGPITLTSEGLTWRNTKVKWSEIGAVDVAEGSVRVARSGKRWLTEDVANVENVHVLLALAAERTS